MSDTFEINVNLSGAKARGLYEEPPAGPHKVEVVGFGKHSDSSAKLTVKLVSTQQTVDIYAGTNMEKAGNRNTWKTIMLSCGYSPAQVEGNVKINSDALVGKTAFIRVTPPAADAPVDAQGRAPLADKNFITPEVFAKLSERTNGSTGAPQVTSANLAGLEALAGG